MDFDLSDEQRLLKDSVDRLLAARYGELKTRMAAMREPDGYSRTVWQEFADLGLLAIPFAEEDGGLGQDNVATMLVAEAIGRNLALEPYFATIVLGGGALRCASDAMRARILPGVIAGTTTLALAFQEKQARYDLFDVASTAKSDGKGGFVIDGEKSVVIHGDSADLLVVPARISGNRRDKSGIGLFLVDAKAEGVSRKSYPTQDGLRGAEVRLAGVRVTKDDIIGEPTEGLAILDRIVDEGIAFLAAEAVGAMGALHELTVDYLKTRKQFGVPIGSFQVLQHRSVDMFTNVEQCRSMAYYATMMAGEPDAAERRRAMHGVKVQIGRSARFIGENAIQLHGGIGMTMEYKAGHYYKRLVMIDLMFGDADFHLKSLAAAGGLIAA